MLVMCTLFKLCGVCVCALLSLLVFQYGVLKRQWAISAITAFNE